MSSRDTPPIKKRESRPGARKVSTLSAEQLERKRANDREAQRSIRQRNKEHIEQLEAQVSTLQAQIAEMRLRNERFDEVVQHNAFLENEVRRLKSQVASLTGRPEFASSHDAFRDVWSVDEASHSTSSEIPTTGTLLPPQFTVTPDPRRAPTLLTPRRASHQNDWQQPYPSRRSPSLGATSDPEFPSRIEPYVMGSHLHQGHRIGGPSAPQISFGDTSSPSHQQSEPFFSQYPYNNRSLSLSSASPAPQSNPAQVYQPSASAFPQSQQRDPTYDYSWPPQS
ncbi:hypothetical protein N7475_009851 [Penicillium sp. IBT 31633x]|nr:hypothetical protein N7475_009851 [Penicillium sp. IBT 31633x]